MIHLIFDVLPQIHGGGNHAGLGAVKGLEYFLTFIESLTSKSPAEIFAAFMPGISAMNNIHPLLVHFPIALFTIFFFADTAGGLFTKPAWRHFATPILYIATLSTILTVVAGLQAAYYVPHNNAIHAIMLRHQIFGITVTVLALMLSLRRLFAADSFIYTKTYGHFALSGLLMICLTFGADLGGLMVYQYGVAVAPLMQTGMTEEQANEHGHVYRHDIAPQVSRYDVNILPQQPQSTPHTHSHKGGHSHSH